MVCASSLQVCSVPTTPCVGLGSAGRRKFALFFIPAQVSAWNPFLHSLIHLLLPMPLFLLFLRGEDHWRSLFSNTCLSGHLLHDLLTQRFSVSLLEEASKLGVVPLVVRMYKRHRLISISE